MKEMDIKPLEGISVQNKRGLWVPAIEEPYYLRPFFLDRCQCRCGARFWGKTRYRAHYALKHILAL